MSRGIFITGGTGHLGTSLIGRIIGSNCKVYVLVRSNSFEKIGGILGFADMIQRVATEYTVDWIADRLVPVIGDITQPHFGLSLGEYKKLTGQVDVIYHSAALLDLIAPMESLYLVNVIGTKNVLDFAMQCASHVNFRGMCHISTFAVSGNFVGIFQEMDLDVGQGFNNNYEYSKFEAEKLVSAYREKNLSITVFRPSIITGDSKSGEARNFHTVYGPLHFLSLGIYDELPAKSWAKFNLVPVDSVVEVIHRIILKHGVQNLNYHLVNPHEVSCQFFIETASSYFGFKKPLLIPIHMFHHGDLKGYRKRLLTPYLPYLNRELVQWATTNTERALEGSQFQWPVFDEAMLRTQFAYCVKSGYILPRAEKAQSAIHYQARFSKELAN
jgi:thioester reductase-like protein